MMLSRTGTMVVASILLLMNAKTVSAQRPTMAAHPNNPYVANRMAQTPPTVSPYLSLGVDANGLSNYQTLVRPLLAQRQQSMEQTAQQRSQVGRRSIGAGSAAGGELAPIGHSSAGSAANRFMNFSHYYRGGR